MTVRRGLTLVEMLASVALLSLLATAAVPLLRMAQMPPPPPVGVVELSRLADLAMADAASLAGGETVTIGWDLLGDDEGAERPPVTVQVMATAARGEPGEAGAEPGAERESTWGGAWVAFTCARVHVFRWVPRKDEP